MSHIALTRGIWHKCVQTGSQALSSEDILGWWECYSQFCTPSTLIPVSLQPKAAGNIGFSPAPNQTQGP